MWTPGGVVRDPVVTLAADGRILGVETCAEPDRLPFTEFRSGMLVPGFPADWREAFLRLLERRERPLAELLAELLAEEVPEEVPEKVSEEVPGGSEATTPEFVPTETPTTVPTAVPTTAPTTAPATVPATVPAVASESASEAVVAPVPAVLPSQRTFQSASDVPPAVCLVVISGLDYRTLHLTAQSRIELLAGPL